MDRTEPQTAITSSPPLPSMALNDTAPVQPAPANHPFLVTSWPKSAQWTVAVLLGGVMILLGLHVLASLRAGARPSEHVESDGPIYRMDLNRAGAAELAQLEGIGPTLAERIVAHRRTHGPYRTVDDLRQVSGIGGKRLDRIRRWVCVEEKADTVEERAVERTSAPVTRVAPTRSSVSKKEALLVGILININEANAVELQRLPRIGAAMSQRIIEERARAPFRSVDELRRVKGIGPKTLAKLRPYVTVENPSANLAAVESDSK
jgi:competence protein ComEA